LILGFILGAAVAALYILRILGYMSARGRLILIEKRKKQESAINRPDQGGGQGYGRGR